MLIKLIRNVFIGLGISSIAICIFVLAADNAGWSVMDVALLRKQVIGSMGYGIFCGIVSLVFESERLPLFWKTGIQLTGLIGGYAIFGWFLGWFGTVEQIALAFAIYIILYIIIWFIFYLAIKRLAGQLNDSLK